MILADSHAVVVGGGPAGLMAAETLARAGVQVDVFDAMPSPGRKFLLAGIGGMNITHSETYETFVSRYEEHTISLRPMLDAFGPRALREWIHALGVETFVGSSGRVFPKEMKAAPLLRAWLHRLRAHGVRMHVRHRWTGWDENGVLCFRTQEGAKQIHADAVVLALGGASWSRLGSDGAWQSLLRSRSVEIARFAPANCGFEIAWSDHLRDRFAGEPVKAVAICLQGKENQRKGEFIVTRNGIEGGVVYALSRQIRETLDVQKEVVLEVDLAPDRTQEELVRALSAPRGSKSLAEHLRRRVGIKGVKSALLHEVARPLPSELSELARLIKAVPLRIQGTFPIDAAISTAGGVRFESLDRNLMVKSIPGVFCAGEMLDWEAPTGGYLLTACFATGVQAGKGAVQWLENRAGGAP